MSTEATTATEPGADESVPDLACVPVDFNQIGDDLADIPQPNAGAIKLRAEKYFARAYASAKALEAIVPWEFVPGESYHVMTGGRVDSMSFLRMVVRQTALKYCLISTWRIAAGDIDELEHLVEAGRIKRIDFYVGEQLKAKFLPVWQKLADFCVKHGGRAAIFRNHSKVTACIGEKFDCVIATSANMNANFRTEQHIITINSELARFYKDWYDKIVSFDHTFDTWEAYQL